MAVHWIVCCSSVLCVVAHGVLVWRVMPYSAWIDCSSILSILVHGVLVVVCYAVQRMNCLL